MPEGGTFARWCAVASLPHFALVPRNLRTTSAPSLVFSVSTRLTPFSLVNRHYERCWYLFRSQIANEFASKSTTIATTMPAAAESWKICCGRLIQS